MAQFLKVNDGYSVKGQVETLSAELTNISKQHYFLDIAIASLFADPTNKDKLVFITSLIKDKFKFDFELVEREKLLYYYSKICEIGFFLGVLTSLFSANTTQFTQTSHSHSPISIYTSPPTQKSSLRPFSNLSPPPTPRIINTSTTTSRYSSA